VPLGVDNVVQENWGGTTGADSTTAAVSLPSGTTAGNTLLAAVTCDSIPATFTLPSGWIKDLDTGSSNHPPVLFCRKPPDLVGAGETSWTFTNSSALKWAWYVKEVTGLDPADPLDTSVATFSSAGTGGSPVTRSTGTTPANSGLDTMQLAVFQAGSSVNTQAPGTWAGYTNGFVEVAEVASTGTSAAAGQQALAIARKFSDGSATGPFECTGTYTPGGISDHAYGLLVAYRSATSPVANPLTWQLGFEHGTHNGLASSTFGTPVQAANVGTVGTDIIVQASSARNSAYGCRIVASAAARYLALSGGFGMPTTTKNLTTGCDLRVVSGTGTVVVAEWAPNPGTILQLVYDVSGTRYGLRWGSGGTVSWQAGTTALNAWVWVDVRMTGVTTATWHADWTLETGAGTYTAQSSPADLTGQTAAAAVGSWRVGGNLSQTVTLDVDNMVASVYGSAYPLGPHVLTAVKVDPAGTPVSSGTVGNFALVTSNATGSALTAGTLTSARDAIDELPPTISASSDGIVQTTTAGTDYLEFPLTSLTLGPTDVINGARLLACLISTTGAGSGNLGIRGYDGTAESSLVALVGVTPGSSTTVGNTIPPWTTAMWSPVNGWTQARLDAATLRIGFSADATPDMGVHAVYLEVAVGQTKTRQLFGTSATAEQDPNRLATMSTTVTEAADLGATLRWTDTAGSGSQYVAASGSYTKQFDPAGPSSVSVVEVESDPEFTEGE
jgi:hypothetical protein